MDTTAAPSSSTFSSRFSSLRVQLGSRLGERPDLALELRGANWLADVVVHARSQTTPRSNNQGSAERGDWNPLYGRLSVRGRRALVGGPRQGCPGNNNGGGATSDSSNSPKPAR